MGPVRRQLTLALLLPTTALAEVCDKTSPSWAGLRLTSWDEVSGFRLSIPGAILFGLALLAIFSRQRWFLVLMSATLALTIPAIYLLRAPPLLSMIQVEGCLGPQGLKFASLALLSGLLLWRARA